MQGFVLLWHQGTKRLDTASRETKSMEWLWEVPKVLALGSLSPFRMWGRNLWDLVAIIHNQSLLGLGLP